MADITFLLLGIIILLAFTTNILFKVTKIPEVLFLIIAGIIMGSFLHLVDPAMAMRYTAIVTTLMLIIVMLDNGLSFDIFKVMRALPLTAVFTLCTVSLTAVAITLLLHTFLGFSYLVSFVVALMMAGTTTDVVTVLVSKMRLESDVKQLLTFESVLNDVQIIPFFILLHFIETATIGKLATVQALFFQMPFAILVGSATAFWWLYILGRFLGKHPLNYVATIGILFILYNTIQLIGGNGAVSVLTFSLILGNALNLFKRLRVKRAFHRKFTAKLIKSFKEVEIDFSFLVRAAFFVFLGIVFSFKDIQPIHVWISIAILAAILLCRYLVSKVLGIYDRTFKASIGPLVWLMPRGYVAAVLVFAAAETGIIHSDAVNIVLMNIFLTTGISILYSVYHSRKTG